jgi:YhcH/YjgK/YiaL family protein
VQRYTTEPADARRYESHRRYIDVQYLLAGREALDVQDIDALTVTEPYDAEKDVMFYSGGVGGSRRGGEQRVVLTPGVCCVLFPEDGHKPCCEVVGPEEVCKVVVKIAIRA